MKKNVIHLMVFLVLAMTAQVVLGQAATPAPPGQISYQGYLTDANGLALAAGAPRNYTIVFRIYDSSAGANVRWAEQQTVTVDRGYFTVMLGSGSASTGFWTNNLTGIFMGNDASDRFIGITVTDLGASEILPRLRLLASPYAFLAANALNATFATNAATATSALNVTGANTISATNLAPNIGVWTVNGGNVYRPSGNVGIGTSTPGELLTIAGVPYYNGGLKLTGNGAETGLAIENTSTGGRKFDLIAGSSTGGGGGPGLGIYDETAFAFRFNINAAGNVGIGTVSPAQKLDVAGIGQFSGATQIGQVSQGFYGDGANLALRAYNSASDIYFQTYAGAATRMIVKNGGNVGIGTVSPASTLDVNGFIHANYMGLGISPYSGNGLYVKGGGVCGIEISSPGSSYGLFVDGGASSYGAYINGNTFINGTLSKSAGSFKIDHPLDPENKWLYHSFVESPDMMNIYNGNIVTDAKGEATVTLPSYFEALNKDFRYQLTVIGQFAQAIVGSEISNNAFVIKTDKPKVKVSWQVTGIRHDVYADAHRIIPEEPKVGDEIGAFQHPAEAGKPESMRFNSQAKKNAN